MELIRIHRGIIIKGRFVPDDPSTYHLRYCALEGKRIEETVRREQHKRSGNQNRYYHGVVIHLISVETGLSPETVHESMRMLFLKETLSNGLESIRSTTTLNTVEMEDYLDKIRKWADEFFNGSLYIPLPNEVRV